MMKRKAMGRMLLPAIVVTTALSLPLSAADPDRHVPGRQGVCCPTAEPVARKEAPEKTAAFRKVQKLISQNSAKTLARGVGDNYLTRRLAPAAFESLAKTFVPQKSGRIVLRDPASILDRTLNEVLGAEKDRLSNWTREKVPALPFLGHLVSALLESQKVQFSEGLPSHQVRFRQKMSHEVQMGDYSLGGGLEARYHGQELNQASLASFNYSGENENYRLSLLGRSLGFDVKTDHLKADFRYNPRGLSFSFRMAF